MQIKVFQAVLAYPDPMLLALVMGKAEPEEDAERGVIAQLRSINANVAA